MFFSFKDFRGLLEMILALFPKKYAGKFFPAISS